MGVESDRTSEHHAPGHGLEGVTIEETDVQTASEIVHDDSLSSIPPRLPDELYKLGEEVVAHNAMNDADVTTGTSSDSVDGTSAASTSQEEDLVNSDEMEDEIVAPKEQNDQYD